MRQLILASGSPRRQELLKQMGRAYRIVRSDFEEYLDDERLPEEMAVELGLGKARMVANRFPDAIVIGSDTIVTVNGHQLGKAADVEQAREMWRLVTSGLNTITTSVVIVCKALDYEAASSDNAYVDFYPYDKQAVEAYLATGDYADKAGAWSIQQARHLMKSIEGNEETILGMPTALLRTLLAHGPQD